MGFSGIVGAFKVSAMGSSAGTATEALIFVSDGADTLKESRNISTSCILTCLCLVKVHSLAAAAEPFSQQEVLSRALLERVKIMKCTSKTTSKSGGHNLMRTSQNRMDF